MSLWGYVTSDQASKYRRTSRLAVAIQVRNQHEDGRRCGDCPPANSTVDCPRLTVWLPLLNCLDQA